MKTLVAGLDLSITETGVAIDAGPRLLDPEPARATTHVIKPKRPKDFRLPEIVDRVMELVQGAEFVLIEGYLNQSKSAGITGMVHGAIRTELIRNQIRYGMLPPSSLKKYATGNGGVKTDKTAMTLAAYKRGQIEFTNNNECDAWWLWVAANDHLHHPVIALPQLHRESLTKIETMTEDR